MTAPLAQFHCHIAPLFCYCKFLQVVLYNSHVLQSEKFMTSALVFQIQSTLILGLLYLGVILRKKRRLHIRIMSAVIGWDVLLILQIELSRDAVQKASKGLLNPLLLNLHVALAVATVLLYLALIYSGRRLLANDPKIRPHPSAFGSVRNDSSHFNLYH